MPLPFSVHYSLDNIKSKSIAIPSGAPNPKMSNSGSRSVHDKILLLTSPHLPAHTSEYHKPPASSLENCRTVGKNTFGLNVILDEQLKSLSPPCYGSITRSIVFSCQAFKLTSCNLKNQCTKINVIRGIEMLWHYKVGAPSASNLA